MKYMAKLRKAKRLTQFALGEAIGIDANTIARYEQGRIKPSLESARKLAAFFSVSVDELLNGPQATEIEIKLVMSFEPMKGGITALSMTEGNSFTLCVENNHLGIIGVGPLETEEDIDKFLLRAKDELMVGLFAQKKKREIGEAEKEG